MLDYENDYEFSEDEDDKFYNTYWKEVERSFDDFDDEDYS